MKSRRRVSMFLRMGFEPISATAAVVAASQLAGGAASAPSQYQGAKTAKAIGRANEENLSGQSRLTMDEQRENTSRLRDNAALAMGQLHADAGKSGLATEGSVAVREQAVANRLETEIRDQARQSLLKAQELRHQGRLAAWEGNVQARAGKLSAAGSLLGSFGNATNYLSK